MGNAGEGSWITGTGSPSKFRREKVDVLGPKYNRSSRSQMGPQHPYENADAGISSAISTSRSRSSLHLPWLPFATTSSSPFPVSPAPSPLSRRPPASTASPSTRACTHSTQPTARQRYAPASLSRARLTPPQLRKVLSKTASTPHSAAPMHPYMQSVRPRPSPAPPVLTRPQPSHADSPNSSPPLMMRKSVRRSSRHPRSPAHPCCSKNQNSMPRRPPATSPYLDAPARPPISSTSLGLDYCRLTIAQNNRGTPLRCISPCPRIPQHRIT